MRPVSPSPHTSEILLFADFKIDLRAGELHRNGSVVRLQRQPLELLAHLARHAGEVVSREELHQRLWQNDTFVDFDNGLNAAISKVREALGDSTERPRFLETLPRRGYRFIAAVRAIPTNPAGAGLTGADESPLVPAQSEEPDRRVVSRSQVSPKARHWYPVFAVLLLVASAAAILIGIWHTERNAPALASEQRLTANPPEAPITAAAISPDGKYVAYADPTGVYVRQIEGGETRPLPLPQGFGAAPRAGFPMAPMCCSKWRAREGPFPACGRFPFSVAARRRLLKMPAEGWFRRTDSKLLSSGLLLEPLRSGLPTVPVTTPDALSKTQDRRASRAREASLLIRFIQVLGLVLHGHPAGIGSPISAILPGLIPIPRWTTNMLLKRSTYMTEHAGF